MSRIFGLKLEPVRRGVINLSYYGRPTLAPKVNEVITVESERGNYKTLSIAHLLSSKKNPMTGYVSNMYSVDVSNPFERKIV